MGPRPHFLAIRIFSNPEGWVANFTGSPIAEQFPRYEASA
jgi:1,2-dihydroxy-3-keto-5-methylthiopentene dioxygenase